MKRLVLAIAALALLAAAPAVRMGNPPDLAKDVDAAPRILSPRTPQTAKINAALDRVDSRERKLVADCKKDSDALTVERTVRVEAFGPRFLSLYVSDSLYCGGAYPDTWQTALTYDLTTGRPINWADYLPADLVSVPALEDRGDGSRIGVLKSPALLAWFRAAVAREGLQDNQWWADCKGVYDDPDLALVLWIDAQQGGVLAQASSLPHAVAACISPQMLSVAELRQRGARPALTDAIAAMQQAKGWRH